ncbi:MULTISPECIES: flagellar export protein FliJ [unclassified Thioalkalivibrio]|uniref:flagellar export protein FliJ n=1 Tax=unclassified Thioalkalivibrio TaxID=2621013 RepID=UPI0003780B8D|nr:MULTISPECIES: flagellar export protein FliJ [unclassified Thioalkalivibrio]
MNPKRLERLLRVRRIEESEATRQLGERLQQLDAIADQRERLETYQREYLHASLPDDANALKWLAGMRDQLRSALEQQDLRIQAAESQVETARQEWLERHRNSLSLEKLLERRRAETAQHDARRQQTEQDMWATRQAHAREADTRWQGS